MKGLIFLQRKSIYISPMYDSIHTLTVLLQVTNSKGVMKGLISHGNQNNMYDSKYILVVLLLDFDIKIELCRVLFIWSYCQPNKYLN